MKSQRQEFWMSQQLSLSIAALFPLHRRSFAVGALAAMLLTACAPAAKQADKSWSVSGTKSEAINHDAWDTILTRYARPAEDGVNRVDYNGIKTKAAGELKAYLSMLQATKISEYPRSEQFAFWVNLYNAATVQVILDNYPLESIRDIGLLGQGPWKDKFLKVEGKMLSLDDVEHGILRPIWKDVRIHYAVNCASIGCPNLALKAYRANMMEPMLEDAARAYINHPRGFSRADGKLVASNIFEWYQSDWGTAGDVVAHARKYASPETSALLKDAKGIDSYDYDWALNDID
jgi:Protein of unknown function, DUF547